MDYDDLESCFLTFKAADDDGALAAYDALFTLRADNGSLYVVYADAEVENGDVYASRVVDEEAFSAAVDAAESGSPKARRLELALIEDADEWEMIERAFDEVAAQED